MVDEADREVDAHVCILSAALSNSGLRGRSYLLCVLLRYLSISHVESFWYRELLDAEWNEADVSDFMEAFLPHRASLKEIKWRRGVAWCFQR
ncbi:hypothetical protein N7523_007236 [Penicillium sp. IBT 18751x]|nr:hypothetical protein N7523_007236 [Penicillium sp. IBT 18751x]